MIKYFNTVSNERGDVLANYRVQVVDSLGASVDIFADAGGTRFTDSGGNIVNYTEAQANGRVAFYWTPADGQVLQTLDASGNLVDAEADFANALVLENLPGNIGQDAVTGLVPDLAAKTAVADLASPDAGKGAALVGYKANIAGAASRTLAEKAGDRLSVTDWPGVVADGTTDNTTAILDFWTALGSTWVGTVYVPQNVKFDFTTVADAAPLRANIIDDSGINGWNTSGFRQKITGVWERGDPTAITDLNYVISSGHNSTLILENRGSSGSVSGGHRVAGVMWSAGRFQEGSPGIRSLARITWGQDAQDANLWAWTLRKMAPWVARDYEIWRAGQVFGAGDYTITDGRTYTTAAGGTAGATQPTHTSGTVSDGGIDWTYVETSQDSTIFKVTERGRVAWNTGLGATESFKWKQAPTDSGNVVVTFEGTGVSRAASLFLYGTSGAGAVLTNTPYIQGSNTGTLRFNGGGQVLAEVSTTAFTIGALGRRASTITNGDTTPSVLNLGEITFANASATTVTAFDDSAASQELFILFANGNTTLQHSGSLQLRGAVNVTGTTGNTMLFKKFASSSTWYEVSRNF